jgi:CRP-like cAMP-binding protein
LFDGVGDDVIATANVRFAPFAPGDVISRHNDDNSPLILVVSGWVQASRFSEDGRETAFAFVKAGGACGETAIILGAPAITSIMAVTPTVVGIVERTEARRLFSNTAVSKALLRLLSNKVELILDNQEMLTLPSAYARIYAVIVGALKKCSDEGEPALELASQATIALAANVSRETVSRMLKALVARGAVTKEGRRFYVTSRNLFEKLAATC